MRFRDFSIRKKLIISYLVFVVSFVVMVIFSNREIHEIERSFIHVRDDTIPDIVAILEIGAALNKMTAEIQGFLASGEMEEIEEFNETSFEFDRWFENYEITKGDIEEETVKQEFMFHKNQLKKLGEKTFSLYHDRNELIEDFERLENNIEDFYVRDLKKNSLIEERSSLNEMILKMRDLHAETLEFLIRTEDEDEDEDEEERGEIEEDDEELESVEWEIKEIKEEVNALLESMTLEDSSRLELERHINNLFRLSSSITQTASEIFEITEDIESYENDISATLERAVAIQNRELESSTEHVLRVIQDATVGSILLSALFLACTLIIFLTTFKSFSKALSNILAATKKIGTGDFSYKAEKVSNDELGVLTDSINKMAEDLNASLGKEMKLSGLAKESAMAEKKKSEELEKSKRDLEKYAAELVRSNKELEEFAYIASHDLQEPLRKVKTFGDRLIQKYGEDIGDEGQDYLKRMESATNRMQILINDLLTYSRVTSKAQPFTSVNLNDIVNEVLSDLEIMIGEVNAQIHVDELPTIEADPLQMRQLFQNLIGNALKFCNPETDPVIEIRSTLESSQGATFGKKSLMSDCFRVITVSDNGIGFEEKYNEQIFSIFQRLHGRKEYQGTGIGLAVCRKIAKRHGGTIVAEGIPDKGSTFTVKLPIVQAKEKEKGDA